MILKCLYSGYSQYYLPSCNYPNYALWEFVKPGSLNDEAIKWGHFLVFLTPWKCKKNTRNIQLLFFHWELLERPIPLMESICLRLVTRHTVVCRLLLFGWLSPMKSRMAHHRLLRIMSFSIILANCFLLAIKTAATWDLSLTMQMQINFQTRT